MNLSKLPHVEKPRDFKDLGPVNVEKLVQLVSSLPEKIWTAADKMKENKFEVFDHTQHIIFRFTPGNLDPRQFYDTPFWTTWSKHLLPVMDAATASFEMTAPRYSKAMFARLKAGRKVDRHRDGMGSNLTSHKIHVPLISNPDVRFHIGDTSRHLEVGHAYEVNNVVEHGVDNMGDEDRVHFIFELYDASE